MRSGKVPKKPASGSRENGHSSLKLPPIVSSGTKNPPAPKELSARQRIKKHHDDYESLKLKLLLKKKDQENEKLKAEILQLKDDVARFYKILHREHEKERRLKKELNLEGWLYHETTKEDERKIKNLERKLLEKETASKKLEFELRKADVRLKEEKLKTLDAQEELHQAYKKIERLERLSKGLIRENDYLKNRPNPSDERIAARKHAANLRRSPTTFLADIPHQTTRLPSPSNGLVHSPTTTPRIEARRTSLV